MKIKAFILLLLMFAINCQAQGSTHMIKFILLIDGDIPVASISNCVITSIGNEQKEISATYSVGELSISNIDYDYLKSRGITSKIKLSFDYLQIRPSNLKYHYEQVMQLRCLTEEYLIMKIENGKSKLHSEFDSYSIEYKIPSFTTVSPKKMFK